MINRKKYPADHNEAGDETEALLLANGPDRDHFDSINQSYSHHPQANTCVTTQTPPSTHIQVINSLGVEPAQLSSKAVKKKSCNKSPELQWRDQTAYQNSAQQLYSSTASPIGRLQQSPSDQQQLLHSSYYGSPQLRRNTFVDNNAPSRYDSESVELNFYDPYSSRAGQASIPSDYVHYTVQPGDTLHNLSIKYSCPIASIKRLNNIWSDQEFYGLTRLKLPAGKLRLIADAIQETNNNINSPNQHSITYTPQADNHTASDRIQPSILREESSTKFRYNIEPDDSATTTTTTDNLIDYNSILATESMFKGFDLNIQKAKTAALSYDDHASAIMQSLIESGNIVDDGGFNVEDDLNDEIKIARREAESLLNDMSDYGVSYSGLILFIFIVCLILPLAYVIYLEETHINHHHHQSRKEP